MLRTILVFLLVFWLRGIMTAHTVVGLIHLLLLLALIVLFIDVLERHKLLYLRVIRKLSLKSVRSSRSEYGIRSTFVPKLQMARFLSLVSEW